MKKIYISIGLVIIIGLGLFYWLQSAQGSIGNLNLYKGSAVVIRDSKEITGSTGLAIKVSDVIKVPSESRVAIILKDGSTVRLEANSEVEVANLDYKGGKISDAVFKLKFGKLWSKVEPLQTDGKYQVETPSVVASVRGTSFNVGYINGISRVFTYNHAVAVALKSKPEAPAAIVNENNIFKVSDETLEEDFNKGAIKATEQDTDDWIIFNSEEDEPKGNSERKTEDKAPAQEDKNNGIKTPEIKSPTSTTTAPATQTPSPSATAPGKTLKSLRLSAASGSIKKGSSTSMKLTAVYSDDTTEDIQDDAVTWEQSPGIGVISGKYSFGALLEGSTNLTATYKGIKSNPVSVQVQSLTSP